MKTALVTGASSGIGAAIARALLQEGYTVVGCARRVDAIPDGVHAYRVDLRQEADILAMWKDVRARFGGVDVLVNNAGVGFAEPLVSGDTERWRQMLEVNVLALCVCTREALADMGDGPGHIVHISSMAGHRVPPGSGVYSATKFAVRSLTEGLRKELRAKGSPVRVCSVSPGLVQTEFHGNYYGSDVTHELRVLDSQDVANAVLYVLAQPPHVQVHDVLMRPTDQVT